jgi:hypothetical protein
MSLLPSYQSSDFLPKLALVLALCVLEHKHTRGAPLAYTVLPLLQMLQTQPELTSLLLYLAQTMPWE